MLFISYWSWYWLGDCFVHNDNNYMFLVDDIPGCGTYGPSALPTADGTGVLHFYGKRMDELTCDATSCSWTTKTTSMNVFGENSWVQFIYIPDSWVTCS